MYKTIIVLLLFSVCYTSTVFADGKGERAPTKLEPVVIEAPPPVVEEEPCVLVFEKKAPSPSIRNERLPGFPFLVPTCVGVMFPIGGGVIDSETFDGTSGRLVCKKKKGGEND
ncbi:MAG: hypothetical protein UZ19_OD1000313 [Parcubacteria bacterium OLB19]|nr:MAG: hypothetical protein UZ19_OD1000313 [Parcubacteria bacterium OLB19]